MKKLFLSSIIFILIVFACSCSNQSESDNTQETSKTENSTADFTVDKLVYESGTIALTCKKIVSDGIEFEVTNKTDSDIYSSLSISLDDVLIDTWNEQTEWTVPPNETKTCKINLDFSQLENTEHSALSICGHVFQDNAAIDFIDICNLEIGGDANSEIIADSTDELYSDEYVTISYVNNDENGINFKITNNQETAITIGLEDFYLNNSDEVVSISVSDFPGKAQGIFIAKDLINNHYYNKAESFQGTFKVYSADKRGEIEKIPISYGESSNNRYTVAAESAYNIAITLTKADLTVESGSYCYNGIPLLKDDCEWIDSSWNTEGTVNQGAIYRKMAYLLEGLKYNDYTDYAEYIIGYIPQTKDDFTPYAENAKNFITINDSVQNIMKKFESLSVVNGEFDYEANTIGNYNITISNLSKCAKEMQISEEILGYIIAFLNEYTDDITFDNNTCTIVL